MSILMLALHIKCLPTWMGHLWWKWDGADCYNHGNDGNTCPFLLNTQRAKELLLFIVIVSWSIFSQMLQYAWWFIPCKTPARVDSKRPQEWTQNARKRGRKTRARVDTKRPQEWTQNTRMSIHKTPAILDAKWPIEWTQNAPSADEGDVYAGRTQMRCQDISWQYCSYDVFVSH